MSSRHSRLACLIVFLALVTGCGRGPEPAAVTDPSRNEVDTPPQITDADVPPLPSITFVTPRPMPVVRAAYLFAARHPEVLSKMPCFCGCQSRGHKHNDDCFVAARDARGRPTKWEPHGAS